MPQKETINSIDLMYGEVPMPFVIRKTEGLINANIGDEVLPHRHNYFSVIWPLGGSGKHIVDFREYPIVPGPVFFVSPMQVHQVIIDEPLTAYVIMFTRDFLELNSIRHDFISNLRLFRSCDETPPLPVDGPMKEMLMFFADTMYSAFTVRSDLYLETAGACLKLFLIKCNEHCSILPGANLQEIEVSRNIVRNFRDLVEKQFTTYHQVQEYAGELSVTPNYLNEVIRESMKIPAKEYIQNRILLEAKRMAVFTEKSAKEIGFDLGFEDPSHFSKFFRTNAGRTIQEFRESQL